MLYDSTYSAVKSILAASGGDMSKEYDSTYDLVVELIDIAKEPGEDSLDFTPAGYSEVQSEEFDQTIKEEYENQIAYAKTIYDNWDPNNTSAGNLFYDDRKLSICPFIDTSNVTSMVGMFRGSTIIYVPQLDTSKVTNMTYMFYQCSTITSVPQLDTSKVTSMSGMFYGCQLLTSVPQLDTSNVTSMSEMFSSCGTLTSIPQLNCGSVTSTSAPFGYSSLSKLTNLGGFKDLKVSWSSNFLDRVPNATVESLMNVINNLYDLTANGLSGGTLKFGTTNLNKLTTDQIAVATNKGWTLT